MKVAVVGSGLVGSLLASYLARRGYDVTAFERRADLRKEQISAGRSINLALSVRGLYALEKIGLDQKITPHLIPMRGRMVHFNSGEVQLQPYGKDDSQCIYSVSRKLLNEILLDEAERFSNVELRFKEKVTGIDLETDPKKAILRLESGHSQSFDAVFGTDGSASVLREAICKTSDESTLSHGYKELLMPAAKGSAFAMEKNALHIWPRGQFMLIALPNEDGSFTCTLFLANKKSPSMPSFEELTTTDTVKNLFEAEFKDFIPFIPDYAEQFFSNPTGHMVTVKSKPWYKDNRALLLGDAAHAIVPFFGQGMNCGFEDVAVFDELLEASGGTHGADLKVFKQTFEARKPNADAIADLAIENFVEMRDKVADPKFLILKDLEREIARRFPESYVPRYSLVTFSRVPYQKAYEVGRLQEKLLNSLYDRGVREPNQIPQDFVGDYIKNVLGPAG